MCTERLAKGRILALCLPSRYFCLAQMNKIGTAEQQTKACLSCVVYVH